MSLLLSTSPKKCFLRAFAWFFCKVNQTKLNEWTSVKVKLVHLYLFLILFNGVIQCLNSVMLIKANLHFCMWSFDPTWGLWTGFVTGVICTLKQCLFTRRTFKYRNICFRRSTLLKWQICFWQLLCFTYSSSFSWKETFFKVSKLVYGRHLHLLIYSISLWTKVIIALIKHVSVFFSVLFKFY